MRINDIPHLGELSVEEKILLVEELWDSIGAEEDKVPIPASHLKELERRLAKIASDPDCLHSLEEFMQRIEKGK